LRPNILAADITPVFDPNIADHYGRIDKITGDGLLNRLSRASERSPPDTVI
jgi:hypothetical protein